MTDSDPPAAGNSTAAGAAQQPQAGATRPDFRGGAVIDADGREVPITEAMIEQALDALQNNKRGSGSKP